MKDKYCMRFDTYSEIEFLWGLIGVICESWHEFYLDDDCEMRTVIDKAAARHCKYGFMVEFEIKQEHKTNKELECLISLFILTENEKLQVTIESINFSEKYEGRRFRDNFLGNYNETFPTKTYETLIAGLDQKIISFYEIHKKISELINRLKKKI